VTACALAAVSAAASADDGVAKHERIVLVGVPDAVFTATAAALGPWSIAVEATADEIPGDAAAAQALAARHAATAVAWFDGRELVLYDALARSSSRQPAPATIDDATAAAVALTIKTALRKPVVVAAAAEPDPPPPPPVVPAPAPAIVIDAPPRPRRALAARMTLDAGARLSGAAAPALARLAVRGALTERSWRGVGLVLGVEGGPSAQVTAEGVDARLSDVGVHAGLELRRAVSPHLWLVPAAGVSVRRVALAGVAEDPGGAIAVDEAAVGASLDVAAAVEGGGRVRGGLVVTASWHVGRVRYTLQGQDVVAVPPVTLGVAVRLGF
jgi:hypothetical protein